MGANYDANNAIGTLAVGEVVTTEVGDTMFDHMLDMGKMLNDVDVPENGRFAILPPWGIRMLAGDARFTDMSASSSPEALRNGWVSRAAGFDVYMSNNLLTDAVSQPEKINHVCMFGHPKATTLAQQLTGVEAYRPELRFADAVKGLLLYGYKVVRPTCLGVLIGRNTA
jgi:P22 coat protein - gene protein 5.